MNQMIQNQIKNAISEMPYILKQNQLSLSDPAPFFLIDIFRFIAASLVLVHLSCIFQVSTVFWRGLASSAVSCFFIVSGFILSYRYPDLTHLDLKRFYSLRFARIYPAYLLGLMIGIGFTIIGYTSIGYEFFNQTG